MPRMNEYRKGSEAIRSRIMSMTTAEGREHGIRKNTLWYLQQRARSDKPFRTYIKVRTRLSQLSRRSPQRARKTYKLTN